MLKLDMDFTAEKQIGLALVVSGLTVFWSAAAFGMHHLIPNGLIDGIVITIALMFATLGFVLLKIDKNLNLRTVLDSVFLFLSLNIFLFEISLYFNPYPNYWWTRQAADWIALIGLGNLITNELAFVVSSLILSVRAALVIQKLII